MCIALAKPMALARQERGFSVRVLFQDLLDLVRNSQVEVGYCCIIADRVFDDR
jgi:hypothetical protein